MPEPAARRRYDFHAHTLVSDGRDSPGAMWDAAERLDHAVLALTDHVRTEEEAPRVLERLSAQARRRESRPSGLLPLVGVEVTQVRPGRIAGVARAARRAGAQIVLVHGETLHDSTLIEGTNRAALDCRDVDVLAHPGLLAPEDADLARAHGIVLELSARAIHAFTNGLVARRALAAGAALVVDTDAHETEGLIGLDRARRLAAGAGLEERDVERALFETPERLVRGLGSAPPRPAPRVPARTDRGPQP
jgi:histidinol phosphatase-like PHP family hydrolase